MKTIEQLVKIAFYKHISYQLQYHSATTNATDSLDSYGICKLLARAARRFVKAEQRHKLHNRIRRQFKGRCEIVAEKGGYNFHDALKRAEQRERKRK
jgi:hypothetical protein